HPTGRRGPSPQRPRQFPPESPQYREARTMRLMRLSSLAVGAAALALLTTTATVAAAQGGTLSGTVTATGTSAPLQEARVIVVGTSLVGLTGPDGKYTIRRLPAGTAEIRVIRVGYQEQK